MSMKRRPGKSQFRFVIDIVNQAALRVVLLGYHTRWLSHLSLVACLLAWSSNIFTQPKDNLKEPDLTQMSLEELMNLEVDSVYGASKFLQKVTEAPASVSIVTAQEIQEYGYQTLADILRSIRGFYVSYDRNYSYLGVRGFSRPGDYNTRILLMVDGHRTNDNVYDAALVGTEFPISVDLIERVEVIRGPSSSLYGTSAFFGVVNIITKRGGTLRGSEFSGEMASFGTGKGQLSYGDRLQNGLEMFLSGSFYNSHGERRLFFREFDNLATNRGVAENADDDRYNQLFANLSFKDFNLQAVYGSREKGIPTASFGTVFNDPRTRTTDTRGYLDLKYEHNFASQWNLLARLYYDQYDYKGNYLYDYSENDTPNLVAFQDYSRGEWWGAEMQASRKVLKRHKVTAGSEYRDNFRQDQGGYDSDPFYEYLRDQRQSGFWAIYLQDEFTINKKLIFNVGLRHDQYQTFGGTTNPRLALIYSPVKKTALKFLYGGAFRAPNAYELFYYGLGFKASPHLRPEGIKTSEMVFEQHLGRRFRVEVSGYYNRINNLISQQTDPADDLIMFSNLERVMAKGVEMELEGKLTGGLKGKISYAFQNAHNQQTGEVLSNSPKHLGHINLAVPLVKEKCFASIDGQYVSKRRTLTGGDANAFFVPNLTIYAQKLGKGFELSASLYNLFNKRYGDPGSEEHLQEVIPQYGRNFRLKLTYRIRNSDQRIK